MTTAVNNKCTYYHSMTYCTLPTSVENDSLMMAMMVGRNMQEYIEYCAVVGNNNK